MAMDIDTTPTPRDIASTLRRTVHEIESWAGHLEQYAKHGEVGSILAANRVAAIVQETVAAVVCAAACDTRMLSRGQRLAS